MKTINEQFEQFADFQRKNLEPMHQFTTLYAQAFERVARKNYDFMGDVVEFAVAQAQVPAGKTDPRDIYDEHSANTKAFAEKVNTRANEYAELVSDISGMLSNGVSEVAGKVETRMSEAAGEVTAEVDAVSKEFSAQMESVTKEASDQVSAAVNKTRATAKKTAGRAKSAA